MKISTPLKVLLGLITAWLLIYPFLFFATWLTFIVGISTVESQSSSAPGIFPIIAAGIFLILICSAFVQVGLQLFYIIHIALNKSANDIVRILFIIGLFFFAYIAMPIYYLVYILPDTPPRWALARETP